MNQRKLLGVRFDAVTRPQALERLLELQREAQEDHLPAQLVATVNVQILVIARHRHPQLLPVLNAAPLVVADGAPLVALSRIFGPRLPERVAGSDLIFDIVEAASRHGLRVYFFGGEEESTRIAIAEFQRRHPALQVAGYACPRVALSPDENQMREEEEMCRQIADARTDILLVGLGCPKQELFVHRNASRLSGMVAIGLGGSFNFVSGRVRRAPLWVQKLGMEWIDRIIQEPRRLFMRYFTDAFFLAGYILAEPFRRSRGDAETQ